MNHFPLPRRKLKTRRMRSIAATIAVCAAAVAVDRWLRIQLLPAAQISGYAMLGVLLFLASFQWRKKLSVVGGLGTVSAWTQLHIYTGFFSAVLFGIHTSWRWPDGWLEGTLAGCYGAVFISGVIGLYLTRVAPRRLRLLPEQVIYECIPDEQRKLAGQARRAMMSYQGTEVLIRFYLNQMVPFLEQTRSWGWFIRPTARRRKELVARARELERYLRPEDRPFTHTLIDWIERKDNLDYHRAVQGQLKLWTLVHVGMTYGLLLLGFVHAVVASVFSGGLS